ncbi:hypothetical protein [Wolbachia endosymbiont of Rhagoletis cerasi]|uniref:hypothetical protein n=1 Tax=Wolbachia endosymbiont of Rhagoletis cerasi TaxID=225363 RepID=UPI001BD634B9|nr:hypothetical protein [Wolbachia endosymbiont of Rhagoletis cerasi]MBS9531348.1 hypothetical protein [Wolbachia endosymbiont of Rhagoletis cerasi]
MKIKGLCVLAVLLTSSLAGAGDPIGELKDKYYAGLNFGAGWGGGFKMKPGVVLGYHHDENSEFELEVLSNVKSLKSIGASLLVNYRFYPDLNIDPVRLYASVGLGGYLQVVPFGFGISNTADDNGAGDGDGDGAGAGDEAGDGEQAPKKVPQFADEPNKDDGADKAADSSLVDKILSSISYKVKLGVDYEITPQIIGTAGMTMGGQLSSFKPPLQIPDAMLEVGIRYNF